MKQSHFWRGLFRGPILMSALLISPQVLANPCQGKTDIAYINSQKSTATPTPYRKLAQAFAELKNGDHLSICAGTYRLYAGIELSDLRDVVIEGHNASLVTQVDMPVVTLHNAYQVTLKGLRLVHDIGDWCAQNTLEIYDSEQVTVINNDLDGSGYFGVALSSSRHTTLKDNLIHNAFYGLGKWDSPSTQISGNTFANNEHNFNDIDDDEIAAITKNNTVTPAGKRKRPNPSGNIGLALFDCSKAGNDTEKTICRTPQLGLLDSRMTKLYHAHKRIQSAADFRAIRQHQLDWLRLRNSCGADSDCVRQMYQNRINTLMDLLPEK